MAEDNIEKNDGDEEVEEEEAMEDEEEEEEKGGEGDPVKDIKAFKRMVV
jgi:hypothetical protein